MKTLEEFIIKEVQDLRKDNKELIVSYEDSLKRQAELIQERDHLKNKYIELVKKLREDFKPEMNALSNGKSYFRFGNNFTNDSEKDDYYKKIFNLKEGETNE